MLFTQLSNYLNYFFYNTSVRLSKLLVYFIKIYLLML